MHQKIGTLGSCVFPKSQSHSLKSSFEPDSNGKGGLGETASANSRMRRLSVFLLIALMMMMMLSFTRPGLVNGRVLASTVKEQRASIHQSREQPNILRGASSIEKETDKPAENQSSRVLIGNEYHTMASGPSRKGSGH
ncbi:hypothetical protein K1719_029198 [Acacia pycnantha]|nr:hypothetical protein K1719_029198 [Acacia pycnantha]